MNKIFVALLLSCVVTFALSACDVNAATACTANGGTCTGTTCSACPSGFALVTSAAATGGLPDGCKACVDPNCATCPALTGALTTSGTCTACKTTGTTYYLSGDNQCTTVNNCAIWASASDCTTCNTKYAKTTATGGAISCSPCTDPRCTTCTAVAGALTVVGPCTVCATGSYYGKGPADTTTVFTNSWCLGCYDNNCQTCAADASTCTACNSGYATATVSGKVVCQACSVANCATCSAVATCSTCAVGFRLISNVCTACTVANCYSCSSDIATCDTTWVAAATTTQGGCAYGYTLSGNKCSAAAQVASSASPSAAGFNVSMATVFASTDTTSFAGLPASSVVTYGPGTDDSTAFVWGVSTASSTLTVIRRQLNATYGASLAKTGVNATDTTISTSLTSSTLQSTAVGAGYLFVSTYVAGGDISITYFTTNGTTSKTVAVSGNTDSTVTLRPLNLWYDSGRGVVYQTWVKSTHTPGSYASSATATPTADSWALNGIYIQGINVTSGTSIFNSSTGGVKALALTQTSATLTSTNLNGIYGPFCQTGQTCASQANSQVTAFIVGGTNYTNSTMVNYLWQDASGTLSVIKTGTIDLTTGIATTGTVVATDVAQTGSGTTALPYINVNYAAAGFLGSSATSGVFVLKTTKSDNGVTPQSSSNPTYTYAIQAYINGSTTAAGNVTIASGYGSGTTIQGFGVSDGFVLMEVQGGARTYPTPNLGSSNGVAPSLLQAERFFTNGSINGAPVSLGTFVYAPTFYQDTNGSIYVGETVREVNNNQVTYQGLLGKYIAQTLGTSGASILGSIFAFLTIMIVALFAF